MAVNVKEAFKEMWRIQLNSQLEMGLNPVQMTDRERDDEVKNMLIGLHEQATQLAAVSVNYKRHILRAKPIARTNVTERVADVVKYALAIAQMHRINPEEVLSAFYDKTRVVLDQARGERLALERDTPVIAVDIDDVLSDLAGFRDGLDALRGADPPRHHALLEEYRDEFHSSGRIRELPVVSGARDALLQFRAAGWRIVLITARPQWQYKRIYSDTLHWLDQHDIPRDLILFNKDKVEAVHRDLAPAWPRAFVEDHVRNALALASAGVQVLLYDREHNRNVPDDIPNVKRVRDWSEVIGLLLSDED
jgi:hypothetical protein